MSQVYIDDVDASLAYSGSWQSTTQELRAYRNTMHFTNSINSKATLTFTGIGVTVYGAIRSSETPQSSYSLDGGGATVYNRSTTQVLSQYGVIFYTSPIVRNGQHTLTITNLNDENTFFIDNFIIVTNGISASTNTPDTSTTTGTSTSSSRSSTSSGVSSGTSSSSSSASTTLVTIRSSGSSSTFADAPGPSTKTPPNSNVDADPATARSNSGSHTAAIIGAVAALAIVALFIIVCLWLQRRRKKQEETKPWIFSSYYGGGTATPAASLSTSLPTVTPEMNEERPPLPPSYAMSEPPAYDAGIGSAVQFGGSQPLGSSMGLRTSEKSPIIATQLESSSVMHGGSSTIAHDRIV